MFALREVGLRSRPGWFSGETVALDRASDGTHSPIRFFFHRFRNGTACGSAATQGSGGSYAYQSKDQSALIHRQAHVVLWDESLDDDTENDGEKRLM